MKGCAKMNQMYLSHSLSELMKFGVLIITFLMTVSSNAQTSGKKIPGLAKAGMNGYIKSELIYPLDNKPTAECHASTIVELSDGLMTAWFGGTHEGHSDVGIWTSININGTWSKPVEVVNGFQNDTLRYPCWNPVLFKPGDGPLMLFYKVGPSPRKWWGMIVTSRDEGRTWSQPKKLGENKKIGHLLGPVKNKPVQLKDGTMICASSTEIRKPGDEKWKVHFEFTRDLGKTWTVVGPINDGIEFDAIQPSILFYPNGKMQILCRTKQDVISQSWSSDNGKTWSHMTATELPNPSSGTDAVTLKDGRQLLVYNHTTKRGPEPRNRNLLNVALSEDGKNWTVALTLENKPARSGYSYPAVIQSSDGRIHITYTFKRRSIKYVVLDPKEIK
jgi:predicted neuraminidase